MLKKSWACAELRTLHTVQVQCKRDKALNLPTKPFFLQKNYAKNHAIVLRTLHAVQIQCKRGSTVA